ncbi:hypothetical protein [Methanocorpusculum parvum]|uniref:Uncharacterized protein n=1 Tax=Methanocorpusculum parvum TaxID=2193 RepID=A0AAX0Q7P4_9EURY|nr:hypothetical protein [Methanocorpusculum parvum]PAV09311.1 hypothetical protein ASJ83_08235 [Methanocorpusculum parvum]
MNKDPNHVGKFWIILLAVLILLPLVFVVPILIESTGILDSKSMTLTYSSYPEKPIHHVWNESGYAILNITDEDFEKYPEIKELFLTRDTSIKKSDPGTDNPVLNSVQVLTRQRIDEIREKYCIHRILYWEGEYYQAGIPYS